MKMIKRIVIHLLAQVSLMGVAAETTNVLRSPVNQVFQFRQSATCSAWTNGIATTATAYLWIPEECRRLRGLLILCSNVPEHMLVGHPAIRKVCASHDLGIFWGTQSFYNFKAKSENKTQVAFLQQLLEGLAKTSGYEEVATVPWLPMGESGHLLMVDALVEESPQRCVAGVWIKNNHLPPKNRQVPALVAFGTAQEWAQDKSDLRKGWNNIGAAYEGILNQRKANPGWPLSYIIDGSSGHFDCSERLTQYFARYIDLVAKARLSEDDSPTLKPVKIESGFVADLPVPGHEGQPVKAASSNDALPWYFDQDTAKEAQAIARINWNAETQLPGLLDKNGTLEPYDFNGIMDPKTLNFEPDGITFTLHGTLLDQIPAGFVGAGEKLAKTPGAPEAEWLCGAAEALGNNRFRIALGRTSGPIYVVLRKEGNDAIRSVVQPVHIETYRFRNNEGKAQTIAFDTIADVKAGVESVPLNARSEAGIPVEYYVEVGPAIVKEGKLVFTKIPPRARFPIEVTVAAWQWGRATEPKVKTAETVKQTFSIFPSK